MTASRPPRIQKTGQILVASPLTDAALVERIDWCGTPAPWGFAFCRTAGCHRCRKHRVLAWIDEARQLFGESRADDMRWLTIMLRPCANVEEIPGEIRRGKVALRNLVYRLREADRRAASLRIIGVSEADWYYAHHVERLSSYKRTQLDSLGFDKRASEVWMPHFHLLVDLAGVPERKLREAVERKWPGARQTDIRPLETARSQEGNIGRLLSYATKSKHYYKIDPFGEPGFVRWPSYAIVNFYNMLFRVGGFSLLRLNIKPE